MASLILCERRYNGHMNSATLNSSKILRIFPSRNWTRWQGMIPFFLTPICIRCKKAVAPRRKSAGARNSHLAARPAITGSYVSFTRTKQSYNNNKLNTLSLNKNKNLSIALARLLANIKTEKTTFCLIGFLLVQSRKNHHFTGTNRELGIDGTL